jgi:hypothetical protein
MVEQLSQMLIKKFGPKSLLLLIVGLQSPNAAGPYMAASSKNVLVYFLPAAGGTSANCPAITAALNWAAGQCANCQQLQDMHAIKSRAMPQDSGYFGMGGIPAFENMPPRAAQHAPPRVPGNLVVNQQLGGIAPMTAPSFQVPQPDAGYPRGSFNDKPGGLHSCPSRPSLHQRVSNPAVPNETPPPPLRPLIPPEEGAAPRSTSAVVPSNPPRNGSRQRGLMDAIVDSNPRPEAGVPQAPPGAFESFNVAFDAAAPMVASVLQPQSQTAPSALSFGQALSIGQQGQVPAPAKELKPGDWCEIWSATHSSWCKAKVMRVDGQMVQVKYRNPTGEMMSKGVPYGHAYLRYAE